MGASAARQHAGMIISGIFCRGLSSRRSRGLTLSVQLTTALIATGKFVGILPKLLSPNSALGAQASSSAGHNSGDTI